MTDKSKSFGEVFDAHTFAEFQARDIEATMATMGGAPHVTHVPTMTGGHGLDGVRKFYETGSSANGRPTPWSHRSRARSARPASSMS